MATISKNNIGTGNTIQAEHITRIIDALNGTGSADIIATGSFTGSFNGSADTWIVQDLTVNGTASINYFETIYETSSIIYQSGSTKFGNSSDDTHQFTGSIYVLGDTEFNGAVTASSYTGSFVGNGSGLIGVISASYAPNIANTNLTQDANRELIAGAFGFDWYNDAGAFLSLSDTYQGFGSNNDYLQADSNGILLRSGNSRVTVTSSAVQIGSTSGAVNFSVVKPDGGFGIDTLFFVSSSGKIITNDGPDYDDFNIKGDTGITGNLKVTGSLYVSNITEGAGTDTVAMYDTGSGRFYYTSSAAIGGAGAGFPFSGSAVITGSLVISGSESPALAVYGSGSTVFTVNGGEIFSVSDSLSGSLFAVNNSSGFAILDVDSDNTIKYGDPDNKAVTTTVKNTVAAVGAFTVYSLPTASYDGAWFEYVAKSGSDARAGQIMSLWSGTAVNFTETTTTDFGNTSGLSFTVAVNSKKYIIWQ
jgi:hypothetical protein